MSYTVKSRIEEHILRSYVYGSFVYGTDHSGSDIDFIVVVEGSTEFDYDVKMPYGELHVYSEPAFIKKIQEHHINALECIFQVPDDPYLKYFHLDTDKLRRSISSVSSNSFVKCKKKFKDGEYYIGAKSMFHSLRILGYGIQMAEKGRIVDYKRENYHMDEIKRAIADHGYEWKHWQAKFQPVFNHLKSKFRKLAPLNEEKE